VGWGVWGGGGGGGGGAEGTVVGRFGEEAVVDMKRVLQLTRRSCLSRDGILSPTSKIGGKMSR